MRAHERDEQHPRAIAVLRRLFAQPDLRPGADVTVVGGVRGFAWAGKLRDFPRQAALRQIVADQSHEIALALDDLHGNLHFAEAVVVAVLPAEVELADRGHVMPVVPQPMVPARDGAFIRVGIVPVADLVHILADCEGGARRHAYRRGGVGAGEHRAGCSQRVHVRRFHDRVAGASHDLRVVLVGHDDQQIGRLHPSSLTRGRFTRGRTWRAPAPASRRHPARRGCALRSRSGARPHSELSRPRRTEWR